MAGVALLIVCGLFLHLSLADSTCNESPKAIAVPIRNVTLAEQLERRGIALSVGTSSQPLAFMVQAVQNDTYVWDTSTACASGVTALECAATHGGNFDSGTSSTWLLADSISAAGASNESDMATAESEIWGTDDLVVNSNLTINNYPLAIVRDSSPPSINALGLGRNSTILNALMSTKAIGSRTWGLFFGWIGADQDHQIDGNIVFGGYDAGKITGGNVTIPFTKNSGCLSGLIIEVTDISMHLTNGSSFGILGTSLGSAMTACIEPHQPLITIPYAIYETFLGIAGGTPTGGGQNRSTGLFNFWGMLFEAEGVYTGNLSFTVSPGLTVTIPNHQLVVPDYTFDDNGIAEIKNDSHREILLNSIQGINANDLPLFGWTFLTSAYLLVDEDKEEFTLAQSNAQSGVEQLVAIGSTSTCTSEATATSTPLNLSNTPTSTSVQSHRAGSATGTIVGGVVGGIVGAICICALAIFLLRRRRRTAQTPTESPSQKESFISSDEYYKMHQQLLAMQPPQELPHDTQPIELDDNGIVRSPHGSGIRRSGGNNGGGRSNRVSRSSSGIQSRNSNVFELHSGDI